ncbi:restriction endonuclease subunit S [Aeromonas allosaccharophila]|uniref:Restriction endonuclease subunit S n=1 Tax=Aeromonas allosaccharophila TaxID=656 RepID=A0AAX3NRA0_9GAMM|nr:restriction endonuclease subunit S [Aeromonas allosaccharophila]WED75412.1 restriction endonuclease subunit S [Aeromonas allosaccharophila]
MSSEWVERSIVDVCAQVFSGGTPKSSIPEFFDRGSIPWLKTKEVNYSKIIETENFITELGLKNSSAKLVPINSVIVAMYGNGDTAGRVAINKIALTTNQACCNLVIDSARADYRFVYYYLQSQYAKLVDLKNGGAQQNLNAKLIKDYPIVVPSITEQREIGSFLESLDDRISLLCETNATLEAIAQALFKSWFVDFDPVHARARGEQPAGLAPEVAALFPDSFEESALGMVPKGWQAEPLDEIADFLNGLALQKYPPEGDETLPVIKIAQLRKGDTVGADRASRNIKPEYIIQNGDVLFSWSGSLEVEVWCGGEGALNQHLFKVTSQRFQKWFYLRWTKTHLTNFKHIAASKATTMGHIQRKHLTEAMVVVPSSQVLAEADKIFGPLLDQWINNAEQAQTLANLRDTLLPRLISGQLRLPDAEQQLKDLAV